MKSCGSGLFQKLFIETFYGMCYFHPVSYTHLNTVSVVREETGWLSFGYTTDAKGIGFTAVMLVVAGAVIWGFWKWKKNVEFDERA